MSVYMPEWNNKNNKVAMCYVNQKIEVETLNLIMKHEVKQ